MVYVACVYAASRVQWGVGLPNWILKMLDLVENVLMGLDWLYNRFRRWWNNSAFNAFTWALGWTLVLLLSSRFDWSTQLTRYGVSFVWAFPSFFIQWKWKFLWGDRKAGFASSSAKWWSYWLFSQFAGNMGASFIIVRMTGIPFLWACIILMPYTTVLPYLIRDKWIFPKTNTV